MVPDISFAFGAYSNDGGGDARSDAPALPPLPFPSELLMKEK
jgi:hypothetical protein